MKTASADRLYRVLSAVLGVLTSEITEDGSPDTLPHWDSMSQLKLIVALEAEFGVSISPENAMEMLSVKLIRMILQDIGVKDFQ